jgi:pyridoxamine 5'-phosphate oxidase
MNLLIEALEEFKRLLQAAHDAGDPEPTAMTLATADVEGRISARTVLLKNVDERGFVFYTNYQSNKGRQLQSNPRAALLFLWKTLGHQTQVKIEGHVERVSDAEADLYFASRARASQIGAWASLQSQPLDHRDTLNARIDQYESKFNNRPVDRPPHWSGFRVVPEMIEFWHGQAHRLHERFRFEKRDVAWHKQMLYP